MKRSVWGVLIAVSALGLSALGGCGKASSTPALGGETHWLEHCDGADSCGAGFECVCGVCTNPCSEDAGCGGLDDAAICAAREATPYASACAIEAPARFCVRAPSSELVRTQTYPIEGLRFESRGCFLPPEAVGAVEVASSGPATCKDVAAFAYDGDGKCWRFPSGCVPAGFRELTPAEASAEACTGVDWLCPDALQCDDQHVATVEGCLSCEDVRRALDQGYRALDATLDDSCTTAADCADVSWGSECLAGSCPRPANVRSLQDATSQNFRLKEQYCWESDGWASKCGQTQMPQCGDVMPLACIDGHCRPGVSGPCAERDSANCAFDGQCKLARAYPYGPSAQCLSGDAQDIACVDVVSDSCEGPTHALDSAGNCYLLALDVCPPDGFRIAPDGDPCSSAPEISCPQGEQP